MGIFSKFVNDLKKGEVNIDALKESLEKAVGGVTQSGAAKPTQAYAPPQPAADAPQRVNEPRYSAGPSGFSWGEDMPAEENQYNFSGGYIQYFETVFKEDFGEYVITKAPGTNDRSPVFTFTSGGRKALIVELKSETSSAQRIRKAAQAEGVPYLRFYYDHDGWWNTRAYVRARVSKALSR